MPHLLRCLAGLFVLLVVAGPVRALDGPAGPSPASGVAKTPEWLERELVRGERGVTVESVGSFFESDPDSAGVSRVYRRIQSRQLKSLPADRMPRLVIGVAESLSFVALELRDLETRLPRDRRQWRFTAIFERSRTQELHWIPSADGTLVLMPMHPVVRKVGGPRRMAIRTADARGRRITLAIDLRGLGDQIDVAQRSLARSGRPAPCP